MADLERLGAAFRHELNSFGVQERSVWKRLIGDQLTRGFYETLRSDAASFGTNQLVEFAERSLARETPGDWKWNYEVGHDSPGVAADNQLLTSVEGRYELLNADIPTIDFPVISERVTRELSRYADAVGVGSALKVKVEDLLINFDQLTGSLDSLKSDCGPQSDSSMSDLIR